MRQSLRRAAAPVLLLLPAPCQSRGDRLTAAQVDEDLRVLAAAMRREWSYFEFRRASRDVDLDRLLADVRERSREGVTRQDLADALRAFLAALHDGHARLSVPGVVAPVRYRLPVQFRPCAEGVVITQIVAAISGSRPAMGPQVGDLLRSIDGVALDEARARTLQTAMGSTPGMRERVALNALLWSANPLVTLELEAPDGTRRTVTAATLPTEPQEFVRPRGDAPLALSWPAPGVALLRIPTFAVGDWQRWLRTPPASRDALLMESRQRLDGALVTVNERQTRALILDLRGNGGGTDALGIHLAGRLLAEPFQYYRLSALRDGRWSAPAALTYQPGLPTFAGAVVALIDAGTFSTTSNLVRCLRDLHADFAVVGRLDGAGTGAPRTLVTLPHSRAEVGLCTQRVYGPRSGLIEGTGTVPDRVVTWTRADVLRGADPDLAEALRLLR